MNAETDGRVRALRLPMRSARLQALQKTWAALGDRERVLISAAGVLIAAALLWWLLISPPLTTLREAPARLDALENQTATMRQLASEARELRKVPRLDLNQSTSVVKAASARLGAAARLSVQGERATLTLQGVEPEALRAWLAEVRSGGRARPVEAQLTQSPKGFTGTVVVQLGGAP